MAETINPVAKKYAGIDLAGKEALSSDAITEFTGFPESLKNRLNLALRFTPESEFVFLKRVVRPVKDLGEELGIHFMLSGRDFPLHSTLLEGLYEGEDSTERSKVFETVTGKVKQSPQRLVGKEVEFQYLLIDKGNLLLTAIEIPNRILDAREQLTQAYTNQGLKPLSMENMLHISVARITTLPKEDRSEKIRIYGSGIAQIRHSISSKPLHLKVESLSAMSAFDLLHSKP